MQDSGVQATGATMNQRPNTLVSPIESGSSGGGRGIVGKETIARLCVEAEKIRMDCDVLQDQSVLVRDQKNPQFFSCNSHEGCRSQMFRNNQKAFVSYAQ